MKETEDGTMKRDSEERKFEREMLKREIEKTDRGVREER